MKEPDQLQKNLHRIDGRGYKAYKDITGKYDFDDYILNIDHVQGDPYATPSKFLVIVDKQVAGFPERLYSSPERQTALEDFLLRRFNESVDRHANGNRGSGKSGRMYSDRPGQQILKRSALIVRDGTVEVRFSVGLPARGRKVMGYQARRIAGYLTIRRASGLLCTPPNL